MRYRRRYFRLLVNCIRSRKLNIFLCRHISTDVCWRSKKNAAAGHEICAILCRPPRAVKIILSTPFGGKITNNLFAKPLRVASNTFCFGPAPITEICCKNRRRLKYNRRISVCVTAHARYDIIRYNARIQRAILRQRVPVHDKTRTSGVMWLRKHGHNEYLSTVKLGHQVSCG